MVPVSVFAWVSSLTSLSKWLWPGSIDPEITSFQVVFVQYLYYINQNQTKDKSMGSSNRVKLNNSQGFVPAKNKTKQKKKKTKKKHPYKII